MHSLYRVKWLLSPAVIPGWVRVWRSGLAEAGCDIVGINIVEPVETIERVTALGRRFLSLTADLRQIDGIPQLLERAVAEFGHIDILVNNAGLIRRQDALEFSEKDWDDVMDLNIKTVFFMSQAAAKHLLPRVTAARLSTSRRCSLSRAVFAYRPTPHQKVV